MNNRLIKSVSQSKKYNCELIFCTCEECEIDKEVPIFENSLIKSRKFKSRKFKSCYHGSQFTNCRMCQMVYFLLVQKRNPVFRLYKDLNKIIFSELKQRPTELYCCRCCSGYKVLSKEKVMSMGYSEGAIMAKNCDSLVKFHSRDVKKIKKKNINVDQEEKVDCDKWWFNLEDDLEEWVAVKKDDVLVVLGECSKYGEDGFSITAGFFTTNNGSIKQHLTVKKTKRKYKVKENNLVCDKCIDEMIENGELQDGGGVNEVYNE